MLRERSAVRPGWEKIIEEQGLAFHRTSHPAHLTRPYWDESVHYVFDMEQVLALEKVVEDLHQMCLQAVEHVVTTGRYHVLGLPDWLAPSIEASWRRRDPYLYGRFDLRYDGEGPAKLLEYNADTPTCLVEGSVVQWFWKEDLFPEDDQWNSVHEALIARWEEIKPRLAPGPVHFAWPGEDESGEDYMTIAYIQETAEQAGLQGVSIAMEDIGWHSGTRRFVDLQEREIRTISKLYPWEWIVTESFGRNVPEAPTAWIEPMWKMLLSNKGLLVLLWELFPGHPNLLPAYLNTPANLTSYIQKPLLGREGNNMRIVTPDGPQVQTGGDYGAEGYVFQEFMALPEFDGQYPVLGTWVVGDESVGLGIRETTALITDDTSSFVPHRIRL
ncbi:glutathionylspermidine synthase family protein [Actinomadura scrupuli]|uniref:glutathionylspermidine synthase family protein n=1 Tax=Actinomadura scrupuli TaxID=559629 RepID=UPI003D95952A